MTIEDFNKPQQVKNVYVKIGAPLTPSQADSLTYQFQLVTFQNVQVQVVSKVNKEKIESMMEQTQKLCLFSLMGQTSSSSSEFVFPSVWSQELSHYSSGIITKNHTIIPQIVIIQKGDFIDNGVGEGQNKAQSSDITVDWKSTDEYATRSNTSRTNTYGIINTQNLSYFLEQNKEKNTILSYTANKGLCSFALMFQFVGSQQLKDGVQNPGVSVDINGDTMAQMFLSNTSQVMLQVNGMQVATGSVTKSTIGYNVPHIKNNLKIQPITVFVYPLYNALAISSNLSSSIISNDGVIARISSGTFNAVASMIPSLSDFPGMYMKNESVTTISVSGETFDFTDIIKVQWINSYGSFCYCPITFAQCTVFDFYFVGQLKNSQVQGIQVSYRAFPIFSSNGSGYEMSDSVVAEQFNKDTESMKTIWKFNFSISSRETKQACPGQMFGFIKVLKKNGTPDEIVNRDGKYVQSFNRGFLLDKIECPPNIYIGQDSGWSEYITNIQTQVSFQGMSGTLTLDKYAMKQDLTKLPEQNIGAITLHAFGGAYKSFFGNPIYDQQQGLIFKGYALQTSNSLSQGSATMNVTLIGVERKLQDIKMINAPFWDGDLLFGGKSSVIEYFRSYTGCHFQEIIHFLPNLNINNGGYILPKSDNYQKPAINFTTGTSCLQALKVVAQKCDLKMVIQPNGHIYFYETDEQFLPYYLNNSVVIKNFDQNEIISYNISPSLQNRFNSFATMGFLTTSTPQMQFDPTKVGTIPGILMDSAPAKNGFDFPWSRIISQVIPGWLTAEQLRQQHEINKKRGKAQIYQGSITVAGISNLCLYDKISIGGLQYFITSIAQNIDLQNKMWTTQLGIARYYSR